MRSAICEDVRLRRMTVKIKKYFGFFGMHSSNLSDYIENSYYLGKQFLSFVELINIPEAIVIVSW